jgi:hypothetical protein
MFDYDWFDGTPYQQQIDDARWRCTAHRFPDVDREAAENHQEFQAFLEKLEVRTLVYLRDGFSYELKELADVDSKSNLTFECEPIDEHYKVGAFVVAVPFDDIVRVEVFAVHPSEKPEDMPLITGFRSGPEAGMPRDGQREDPREPRS